MHCRKDLEPVGVSFVSIERPVRQQVFGCMDSRNLWSSYTFASLLVSAKSWKQGGSRPQARPHAADSIVRKHLRASIWNFLLGSRRVVLPSRPEAGAPASPEPCAEEPGPATAIRSRRDCASVPTFHPGQWSFRMLRSLPPLYRRLWLLASLGQVSRVKATQTVQERIEVD